MMMMNYVEIEVTSRRCKVLGSAVLHSGAGLFSATQDGGFSLFLSVKTHSQVWELAPPLVEMQNSAVK